MLLTPTVPSITGEWRGDPRTRSAYWTTRDPPGLCLILYRVSVTGILVTLCSILQSPVYLSIDKSLGGGDDPYQRASMKHFRGDQQSEFVTRVRGGPNIDLEWKGSANLQSRSVSTFNSIAENTGYGLCVFPKELFRARYRGNSRSLNRPVYGPCMQPDSLLKR